MSEHNRAAYLMRFAENYIQEHAPAYAVRYDNAICDGSCLADDLEGEAERASPPPHTETLRDRFAMAALTGLMSAHDSTGEWTVAGSCAGAAELAYAAADACLAERAKGGAE